MNRVLVLNVVGLTPALLGQDAPHLSALASLAKAKDTLQRVAMFDTLTGALNQRAFIQYSHGELERARRAQEPLSMIALDVDQFQLINEKFGRNIGNDVLTVVAKGIREKTRPYDGVGRYEADTFLLILPGVIGQDAERIARRILSSIHNTEISLLDGTIACEIERRDRLLDPHYSFD